MTIQLSPQQKDAVLKAENWLREIRLRLGYKENLSSRDLVHVISGYAGTGKTTCINYLVNMLKENSPQGKFKVKYAAYTGKAALVMQKYNDVPAQTIHSLIYLFVAPDKNLCEKLKEQIAIEPNKDVKKQLQEQLDAESTPHFTLNEESSLYKSDLLVLDECSMVNSEILDDLIKFQIPIIALGDNGQLPPVTGTGALFSLKVQPDSLLTEIHRQAAGNPIINAATLARKGIPLPPSDDINSQYFNKPRTMVADSLIRECCLTADQILVGKHVTRRGMNMAVRQAKGFTDFYPVAGDKIVCRKNNRERGLLNGLSATVIENVRVSENSVKLIIKTELQDPQNTEAVMEVDCLKNYFEAYRDPKAMNDIPWWERKELDEFDYGYAITVHTSQGSQWDTVVLYDDKMYSWDRGNRKRWLYTATTRAAKKLIVFS